MTTPDPTTPEQAHETLRERARALLEALDKMYGAVSLSENVRTARDALRAHLQEGTAPDPADEATPPPAAEPPATVAPEPSPSDVQTPAESAGISGGATDTTPEAPAPDTSSSPPTP